MKLRSVAMLATYIVLGAPACSSEGGNAEEAATVESAEQALNGNPIPVADADAVVLAPSLDPALYKDIAASPDYLYALTTSGLKRVAHPQAANLVNAPDYWGIQLDAIDYVNTTFGLVGALSRGHNQRAKIILRADSPTPVTVDLPEEFGSEPVLDMQARLAPSGALRVFLKTYPNPPVDTVIREYEYQNSSLVLVTSWGQDRYAANGFTLDNDSDYVINWTAMFPSLYREYIRATPRTRVSESHTYDRTYPGGVSTAMHVHGFDSSSGRQFIHPRQMELVKVGGTSDTYYFLSPVGATERLALVRLDGAKVDFTRTPAYEPAYWNGTSIQWRNNCYNYGTNNRTDTFAQPGEAAGLEWQLGSVTSLIESAVADGLEYLGNPSTIPVPPPGKSLVAAIVGVNTSDSDYHWYRKERGSIYWSHKPGGGAATNLDAKGFTITDPRTAAWNTYYYDTFAGFFLVDSNSYQGMGVEYIK